MWSFEILDRVQAERTRVREVIAEVERKFRASGCPSGELCAHVRALRDAIVQYTQAEDSLLPEALSTVEGWGAEQLAQLEREHARRRQVLDNAMAVLEACSPMVAAGDGRSTVIDQLARHTAELLKVLASEDDEVLDKAVERDEATRYDGFGG